MKKFVRFALAALFLAGIAVAQNIPAIDLFGGYSYLRFDQPTSNQTDYQQFDMNGWEFSASVRLLHHLSVEGDLSGHRLSNCADSSGSNSVTCSDFSYMIGPRFTVGDRSSKITGFLHVLVGQDRATLFGLDNTAVSDTSVAFAAGVGVDYWFMRHIGLQLGPVDYFYTNHLTNDSASSQGNFRLAGGVAFRIGGDFPPPEPKAPKEAKESEGHRSWLRPWHKSKPEGQPSESQPAPARAPRPAPSPGPPATVTPSRGMPVHSLGLQVAPQEFDGARILAIEPGSVAEM